MIIVNNIVYLSTNNGMWVSLSGINGVLHHLKDFGNLCHITESIFALRITKKFFRQFFLLLALLLSIFALFFLQKNS